MASNNSMLEWISILHNSTSVPHNSAQPGIFTLNVTFIAITCSIIILRVLVRIFIVKHVALEDYLMVAAGLFATAFSTMAIVGLRYGLGKHIWDLSTDTLISNVKKVIKTLWICQVMYSTALTVVKLSIIAVYHRIFPTIILRRIMYTLAGFIGAVWIGAWNFEVHPKCISITKVYYFSTAFSILTDVLLCVLPLPLFWKLKLPVREKWIVMVLFGLGLFASVASIMRITVLHHVENTDVTIGAVSTMNWSVAEVGTGIICACVPCLKPLFKKLLPGKFSTARSRSRSQPVDSKVRGPVEEAMELKRPNNFSRPTNWHGRQLSTKQATHTTMKEFV